jgi:hypothetical protein
LVWHTALPCHFGLYQLTSTTVFLKQRLRSLARIRTIWEPQMRSSTSWAPE